MVDNTNSIGNNFTDSDLSGQVVEITGFSDDTVGTPVVPSASIPSADSLSEEVSFTDTPETSTINDITEYIDVDVFNRVIKEDFPSAFGIGFATITIFVLVTYGVSKAISLVRIKK